jgi:Hemerythrin HHE cation binding domain
MNPRSARAANDHAPTAKRSAAGSAANEPTARAAAAPRARDAIVLLKADHAEVKKMHRQYKKLADAGADAASRGALAIQLCHALTAHATAEEELFYPAAREALEEQDLVDHADVEHACAKDLIGQIEAMQPDDSHYDAKVLVLFEYVDHHVKEEEGELFPACREAGTMDLKALGAAIAERKAAILADLKATHPHHHDNGARPA